MCVWRCLRKLECRWRICRNIFNPSPVYIPRVVCVFVWVWGGLTSAGVHITPATFITLNQYASIERNACHCVAARVVHWFTKPESERKAHVLLNTQSPRRHFAGQNNSRANKQIFNRTYRKRSEECKPSCV